MEKDLKQLPTSCLRAVVYGPECSGKTTLAQQLADHYQTLYTGEYAREFLQKKWDQKKEVCELSDLPLIVSGQLQWENQAVVDSNRLLICDTNVLVTRVWSETHFKGYCDPQIIAYCDQFHYDHYLLTGIDIPWQKDDLRDRPHDREYMFDYFKNILDQRQENYSIIIGNEEERLEKAVASIDQLLKKT